MASFSCDESAVPSQPGLSCAQPSQTSAALPHALTGMSTRHSSPPILQFICRAILVAMAMTVCCLPRVRATTHWLGVGQSVQRYFLMASYLSLRLLDSRQTTCTQTARPGHRWTPGAELSANGRGSYSLSVYLR